MLFKIDQSARLYPFCKWILLGTEYYNFSKRKIVVSLTISPRNILRGDTALRFGATTLSRPTSSGDLSHKCQRVVANIAENFYTGSSRWVVNCSSSFHLPIRYLEVRIQSSAAIVCDERVPASRSKIYEVSVTRPEWPRIFNRLRYTGSAVKPWNKTRTCPLKIIQVFKLNVPLQFSCNARFYKGITRRLAKS